jgi:hypothetical protein
MQKGDAVFEIHKRLVTDENMKPIAVQIDYGDWLRIEKAMGIQSKALKTVICLAIAEFWS